MPHFPAEPGRPRELTSVEWAGLRAAQRRQRPLLVAVGAGLLSAALFFAFGPANSQSVNGMDWFALAILVPLGGLGALLVGAAVFHESERPRGRVRRVGHLTGLVRVSGTPPRVYVGPVPVVVPSSMDELLARADEVDVEITPPLEDEPRTRIPRRIVSADRGRLWIADASNARLRGATAER